MPWEIVIRSPDNAALGELASVRDRISSAVPDLRFYREPSGPEKIAAAREAGFEFPDVIRKHFEQDPASLHADFEGSDFSLHLYGFESQPLQTIYVEVRGNGNPLPVLAALCKTDGWVAIDCASNQPLDLTGKEIAEWEAFGKYRDRAIRSIMKCEKPTKLADRASDFE